MSATAKKNESLVWTDDEVELLLRVTLEYKTTRYQENVEWESCQSKYQDIGNAFRDQYPRDAAPAGKEFPHEPSTITKAQITAKLKAVRSKYRHAVDSGRRSGHGLVILTFFELCHEIWGGSPATTGISSGFESGDLVEETSPSSPQSSIDRSVSPAPTVDREAEVVRRRNLLQEKLKNHRTDRLKRKAPAEASENEEKQYRKRALELMESFNTRLGTTQEHIANHLADISNTLKTLQDGMTGFYQQEAARWAHAYGLPPHHAAHFITPAHSALQLAPHPNTPAPHVNTPSPHLQAHTPSHDHPNYTGYMPSYTPSHTPPHFNPRTHTAPGFSFRRVLQLQEDDEDV